MGLILKKKLLCGILDSNYFPLSSWTDQDQENMCCTTQMCLLDMS